MTFADELILKYNASIEGRLREAIENDMDGEKAIKLADGELVDVWVNGLVTSQAQEIKDALDNLGFRCTLSLDFRKESDDQLAGVLIYYGMKKS